MDVGSICGGSGHEYLVENRFDSKENDLFFEIRDGDENVLYSASYSKITGIDAVAAGDGCLWAAVSSFGSSPGMVTELIRLSEQGKEEKCIRLDSFAGNISSTELSMAVDGLGDLYIMSGEDLYSLLCIIF